MSFTRRIENFTCAHCGTDVTGNGYTNHCPKCLWSKHVDVQPGDRMASCDGLMVPTGVEEKHGDFRLVHRCKKCGHVQPSVVTKEDDHELVLHIAQAAAKRIAQGSPSMLKS